MKQKKEPIAAAVRNELRKAISLKTYDVLHKKGKMKVKDQEALMFEMCHGNAIKEIQSHMDLLLQAGEIEVGNKLEVEIELPM